MTGDVSDEKHVARNCPPKHVDKGIIKVSAFFLRPIDNYLSVNCLEMLSSDGRKSEIASLIQIYANIHLSRHPDARIAVLNVGRAKSKVRSGAAKNIRILHESGAGNESHCGIHFSPEDNLLIARILLETISDIYRCS